MKTKQKADNKTPIVGKSIALIQSCWHRTYTDRMVEAFSGCCALPVVDQAVSNLNQIEQNQEAIHRFMVPGCYEIPLLAKRLAKIEVYDAIVIFGAIIKGDTDHYAMILDTCTYLLAKVMYDYEVPIINEIIPAKDLKMVITRSKGKYNKGIEAANALKTILCQ